MIKLTDNEIKVVKIFLTTIGRHNYTKYLHELKKNGVLSSDKHCAYLCILARPDICNLDVNNNNKNNIKDNVSEWLKIRDSQQVSKE